MEAAIPPDEASTAQADEGDAAADEAIGSSDLSSPVDPDESAKLKNAE